MQIIDATLSLLDATPPTKEQAKEFIRLFLACGISDFMVSKTVYPVIEEAMLPEATYYMEIESSDDRRKFPRIRYFIQAKQVQDATITMVQINDIQEVIHLRTYTSAMAVLLIGMDDFMCYDFQASIKEMFHMLDRKKIYFMPENGNECATAEAVMFIKEGGNKVITSFAGLGNKAATEQVILALRLNNRYKVNQDLSMLPHLKELYEQITGESIPDKMPVIGKSIFWVESGIHVDGIRKKASNYETFPPELVGQQRRIVIGRQSGLSSIKYKLEEYGYSGMSNEICTTILLKVKEESTRMCRNISDAELKLIVEDCL